VKPVASADVDDALRAGRPVVALESSAFSAIGLPEPLNREALDRCLAAIRREGAVPALTAVLDGELRVGLAPSEHKCVLGGSRRVALPRLAVAAAQAWDVGVTTVSAGVAMAGAVGVRTFATGGIGGVHRTAARTGDVSADLPAIAARAVTVVCSGAKAFLDMAATLQLLEHLGVTVIGFGVDELPGFWTARSGLPVPRLDTPAAIAAVAKTAWSVGSGGPLVVVPPPAGYEIEPEVIEAAIADVEPVGAAPAETTPLVLAEIARRTNGRTTTTNAELLVNNAAVAARIARELA
jgi:pseudouridine-5'-phosphate glycosidase